MTKKFPRCDITHLKSAYELIEKKKHKFDPAKRDEIFKRALKLEARLDAAARVYASLEGKAAANKAANRALLDYQITQRLGKVNELNPANHYRLQSFIENWLGIQTTKLFTGGKQLSDVGAVRQRLLEARRLGANYIDLLTMYKQNDSIRQLHKRFTQIARGKHLSKREISELLFKAREIGQIPQQKVARNIHPAGQLFLDHKYEKFIQELKDKGFTNDEIEEVLDLASRIFSRMDAVRVITQALGVDIGNVEGIGYIPRVFTPEAKKFIKGIEQDQATSLYKQLQDNPNPMMLEYHFQKSRQTFNFIPEDEVIVSAFLGIEPEQLRNLIINGDFVDYLHKNVDPGTIDELVDAGILSKVPMTTDEMVEYVVSKYGKDLPFKELEEILVTDPSQLYTAYKEALQRAASEGLMVKQIVHDGVGHGWAVTEDMYRTVNPDGTVVVNPDYKDYVKFNAEDIQKYYNDYIGGDVYVHPVVWGTFRAIDDLTRSPEKLSTVANVFRNIGGLLIQSTLISPGYILRNLWTNLIGLYASGGNLLRVWEGFSDVSRVMKYGLDALDNTNPVYKLGDALVTKRRLFEEVFLHIGNNYIPQSVFLKPGKLKFGNPVRGIQNLINYSLSHGFIRPKKPTDSWGEGLMYAIEQLRKTQDVPMSWAAIMSQFNESAMKWAAVVSRADTRPGNRVGQFLTATSGVAYDDFAQEMRYIDNFFYMWDDVGRLPAFVGRYIMPFAPTLMKIPPAVVRFAMANPRKFINYIRVRNFINQGAEDDPEYINAGLADWKADAGLLHLYQDPESGNWIGIMPNSYDPILSGLKFFEIALRNLGASMGIYSGSAESQTRYLRSKYDFKAFLAEIFKQAPPLNKWIIEYFTDIDLRTGIRKEKDMIQQSPTFLGFRWYHPNPAINAPLQVLKGILEQYPPLAAFNRWNPGGVFGVPEVPNPRDPFKPLVPGKQSIFGAQRTEGSLERYYPEMQSVLVLALDALGLSPTVVDQARQTQLTHKLMKSTLSEMKADIRKYSNKIYRGEVRDEEELDNLYNQIRTLQKQKIVLEIHMRRLELWMKQRNIPTKDLWEQAKNLGADYLPPLAQNEADEIALDYLKQVTDLDEQYNKVKTQLRQK